MTLSVETSPWSPLMTPSPHTHTHNGTFCQNGMGAGLLVSGFTLSLHFACPSKDECLAFCRGNKSRFSTNGHSLGLPKGASTAKGHRLGRFCWTGALEGAEESLVEHSTSGPVRAALRHLVAPMGIEGCHDPRKVMLEQLQAKLLAVP